MTSWKQGLVLVGGVCLAAASLGYAMRPALADTEDWKDALEGQEYETLSETHLTKPQPVDIKARALWKVLSKVDDGVMVEVASHVEGQQRQVSQQKLPFRNGPLAPGAQITEETIEVPAGTFECKKTKVETESGGVTTIIETWAHKGIPVPIKTVLLNENMTSKTVLVDYPRKMWKATADDVKAACRVDMIKRSQEKFKNTNGIYATSLSVLADHQLISKELASGVRDGFKFEMRADEKTFKVFARPAAEDKGFRSFMAQPGMMVRTTAAGREPRDEDASAEVWYGYVQADKDWQEGNDDPKLEPTKIDIVQSREVYIASSGEWTVGKGWKPNGPCGSGETSSFGDLRLVKGENIQIGCLLARIAGAEGCCAFRKDDTYVSFAAKAAGRLQFRVNDTFLPDNDGMLGVFVMVLEPPKDK